MSDGVPRITGSKAVAAFQRAGFVVVRQSGSHHIMKKDGWKNRLSIPVHDPKTVGIGLLRKQIKESGLTVSQFNELL